VNEKRQHFGYIKRIDRLGVPRRALELKSKRKRLIGLPSREVLKYIKKRKKVGKKSRRKHCGKI
jgi:hypothetical protein